MHALVAEDDRVAAEILSKTLTRWEFDVTVVSDGADAWRHLQDVRPVRRSPSSTG